MSGRGMDGGMSGASTPSTVGDDAIAADSLQSAQREVASLQQAVTDLQAQLQADNATIHEITSKIADDDTTKRGLDENLERLEKEKRALIVTTTALQERLAASVEEKALVESESLGQNNELARITRETEQALAQEKAQFQLAKAHEIVMKMTKLWPWRFLRLSICRAIRCMYTPRSRTVCCSPRTTRDYNSR